MEEVLRKYSLYLIKLGRTKLNKEMKIMQIQPPLRKQRQTCISMLLEIDPLLIKQRIETIQNIQKNNTKVSEEGLPEIGESAQIDEKQISRRKTHAEVQIEEIRNHIFKAFAGKFERMLKGETQFEKEYQKSKILKLDDLLFFKVPTINTLLNCQEQIQLHPSKIQYQYQRNIEELLFSYFPQRTFVEIEAKAKILGKEMVSQKYNIKGNSIQNILILYGIKKEQQFLNDFKDPLQELLIRDIKNPEKVLIRLLEKLPQRPKYYEAVISSLDTNQVYRLIKKIDKIRDLQSQSDYVKISSSLSLVKMVRKNKIIFDGSHYSKILGQVNALKNIEMNFFEKRLEIEKWIQSILGSFAEMIQKQKFPEQDEGNLIQNVLIYMQIKQQIQNELFQIDQTKKQLLRQLQRILTQNERIFEFRQVLFETRQSQLFTQNIKEILLFTDPSLNLETRLQEKLIFYQNILIYFGDFQRSSLSPEVADKIILDLMFLIKKYLTLNSKSSEVLNTLNTLIKKHLVPLELNLESREKMEDILKSLQIDIDNICKI